MSQQLSKRPSTALKVSSETTTLRRRLARADQLFSEGLARLQSDYKARVRSAALGESDDESEETAPATPDVQPESPQPAPGESVSVA